MVHYKPIWLDRFPKSRRPSYPRCHGAHETEVVIVGGGLTGCACAWSFAAAGVKTMLLEADRIGGANTAGAAGLVREAFDTSFRDAAAAHGVRAARTLWNGLRRASLDLAAAIRRLGIRCDLAPQDLLSVAPRDPDAVKQLRREYEARREAGFDHSWLTPAALGREASIAAAGAIRTRGFTFDPYRACLGFAAAAIDRGANIFERSPVRRIRANRKGVDIVAGTSTIHAQAVVIANAGSLQDLRALRRHLHPQQRFAVVTEPLPAAVRRELGQRNAAIADGASPPHLLRWMKDDRVMVAGADQPPAASRALDKMLVQRSNQLMYELTTIYPAISGAMPEWAWATSHDGTVDGLPYVGLHRNFPHHLFALGQGCHGEGVAWLAARLLLRQYKGEPDKGDEWFGFGRILK
jgi:glycine/D-amino acid oxidase-like deaminating enzyme